VKPDRWGHFSGWKQPGGMDADEEGVMRHVREILRLSLDTGLTRRCMVPF
jgi:hypothetical protein